jgi:hypothetical protein
MVRTSIRTTPSYYSEQRWCFLHVRPLNCKFNSQFNFSFLCPSPVLIAEFVPKLSLFISLIGALCSTALALVFPPVIELIISWEPSKKIDRWVLFKNMGILIVALIGFATGSYESIANIIKEFMGT